MMIAVAAILGAAGGRIPQMIGKSAIIAVERKPKGGNEGGAVTWREAIISG